ncbi:MAG: helix-turn-helix domain-containing protein [Pseudomonas sp.]
MYELKEPLGYRFDTASLHLMLAYAQEQGLESACCLASTGLEPGLLNCPSTEVAPEQELGVIRNMVASLGEPFRHGFELGLRYDLTVYGIWGLGLRTSAGPLDALKRGFEYWGAVPGLLRIRFVLAGTDPVLCFDCTHLPDGAREFLVGRILGTIYAIHQDLLPEHPVGISRVALTLPWCGGMERVEALFACPVQVEQPEACLVLDAKVMALAFSKANAVIASQCDRHCELEMERRRLQVPVAEQVRQYLQDRPFPPPSLQDVAYALHMSDRSLRRHLEVEGTNWRNLIMEIVVSRAEQRLMCSRTSVQQIADELGYADPSSFSHAFKRWTGMSPACFRKSRIQP